MIGWQTVATEHRLLIRSAAKRDWAGKAFEPYDQAKEENSEARAAGRQLIAEGKSAGAKRRTFGFVNNRLEGSASLLRSHIKLDEQTKALLPLLEHTKPGLAQWPLRIIQTTELTPQV